jgi:hypothetical protein
VAEVLLPGTTMQAVLPLTITTSTELVEKTSTIAMAVMLMVKAVLAVAPVVDVARVGYRHTSSEPGYS